MNLPSADRIRQLVTVGVGTLLLIVMGGVLIAGFRLATQMNANITAHADGERDCRPIPTRSPRS